MSDNEISKELKSINAIIKSRYSGYMMMFAKELKNKAYKHNDVLGVKEYVINENKVLVEYYDSYFVLQSQKLISMDYSVYGGFYAVEDTYFLLTGQNNPSESPDVTCFAITKYDKNQQ